MRKLKVSIQKGNIAEIQFLLNATKKGLIVSKPEIITAYDYLVDNSKRIFKVQVKSNFQDPDKSTGGYGLTIASNSGKYSPDQVDIIACFINGINMWYFFPIAAIEGKVKLTLFPNSIDSKWNKYRESWGVILN